MEAAGAVDAQNAPHRSLGNLQTGFPQLPQGYLKKSVWVGTWDQTLMGSRFVQRLKFRELGVDLNPAF